MTDDRALLEAAAKAAGLYEQWPEPDYGVQWNDEGLFCFGMGKSMLWNPLEDDGDALRLAVKLGVDLNHHQPQHGPHYVAAVDWDGNETLLECDPDPYAATRRAIVRAAASLEKEGRE